MNQITDRQSRFLELFEPHRPNLDRFALSMAGGNRELARDVVAETVMIAYERFETVREPAAFLSFLFTIASRTCRRYQGEGKRDVPIDERRAEMIVDPGTPPDVAADIARLRTALDVLPPKVREAIVLFELIGLPMKEIREIQGGSLTAVKVRVSRGRKRLREILGEEPEKDPAGERNGERRSDLRTHSIGAQL